MISEKGIKQWTDKNVGRIVGIDSVTYEKYRLNTKALGRYFAIKKLA